MLQDTPSAPFGEFLTLAVSDSGRVAVSDLSNNRLLVFDGNGSPAIVLGTRGTGPGELSAPRSLSFLNHDSLLAVVDAANRRLSWWRLHDRKFLGSLRMPVGDVGTHWALDRGAAAFGLWGADSMLGVWRVGDSTGIRLVGTTPKAMRDDPFTTLQHGRPEVVRDAAGFLVMLPTQRYLLALTSAGDRRDSILVPLARRRGPQADLFEVSAARQRAKGANAYEPAGSPLVGMGQFRDSVIGIAFIDVDQVVADPKVRGAPIFGNYRLWLTLMDLRRRSACVDAPIPVHTDVPPSVQITRDSVWVLARRVRGDSVQTDITVYGVDRSPCDWVQVTN